MSKNIINTDMSIFPIPLQQPIGLLSIVTVPGGAEIYIDGMKQPDKTPIIIDLPISQ